MASKLITISKPKCYYYLMTKKCSNCKKNLPEKEFNWKVKGVKRAYYCKSCSRRYIKQHYQNNKNYYLNKARIRNLKLKKIAHNYVSRYLMKNPCVDCGEKDPLVLEFDHKDRNAKTYNISHLIRNGSTLSKLKKEIKKCDVRCANCHRRKTSIENNSWKQQI